MRELVFAGKARLEWHEHEDLRIAGDGQAIVRPIASTACDLDRRIVAGQVPFEPPFPIGHECVAEVMETGERVETVRRGDIVVVPWHICCGICGTCRRGLTAHCEAVPGPINGYGISLGPRYGGLFSEQVRVPFADGMLVKVPHGLDPVAVASASDNLTDAYMAVARGLAKHPGAAVLIVGGVESLGLFAVQHAIANGVASVDFVDPDERRRVSAASFGAKVHAALPESFTSRFLVVIGASRNPAMLGAAIRCLAPGGHLSNVALYFGDTPLPLWDFYQRDASFTMGMPSVRAHISTVLELARCGHIQPMKIMTPHPWDSAPEALLELDIKPVMVRPALLS
jgi:threonine dehydrogenase-like Zn-dependent dehydrogenase